MKKHILFTLIILGIVATTSVKAQFSIGPGVLYGTKIEQLGLSANVNYDISHKFGVIADYSYWFPKNSLNWWSLDFDGTYNFYTLNDKNSLYALAGLDLLYYKVPSGGIYGGSSNYNYSGLNIGAGWKVLLSNKMNLIPEVRYTLGDVNYFRVGVELMFGL